MPLRLCPAFLLAVLLATRVVGAPADPPAPPEPAAPTRELAIVVVESLEDSRGAVTAFDRLDLAFHDIAKARKWPITLVAERFAANTPDHPIELRIFNKGISEDIPGELTFRAWVTLTVEGTKHDFGIVRFVYQSRFGERPENIIEGVYVGAAKAIANKIEPILFPKTKPAPAKP